MEGEKREGEKGREGGKQTKQTRNNSSVDCLDVSPKRFAETNDPGADSMDQKTLASDQKTLASRAPQERAVPSTPSRAPPRRATAPTRRRRPSNQRRCPTTPRRRRISLALLPSPGSRTASPSGRSTSARPRARRSVLPIPRRRASSCTYDAKRGHLRSGASTAARMGRAGAGSLLAGATRVATGRPHVAS